jgi:predicted metal-dependent HD superfamily phosphohydrolase
MSEPDLELTTAWQRYISDDQRLLDGLLGRHREKHRRYHTAVHVRWVIRHAEAIAAEAPADHLDEVVAAAFYHDAVYEPTHPANERASARLARRDLTGSGWDVDRVERVGAMIEATAHMTTAPDAPAANDTPILLDADLAVLGAEPAAYSTYVAGVRGEYRHLDDGEWAHGRADVLRSFLDRDTIFTTAPAVRWWEERARANLSAELATLS